VAPRQIIIVCLRLLALVWLLYALNHSYGLFVYANNGAELALSKSTVAFFAVLQVATCAVLWLFPASIAAMLLPSVSANHEASPSNPVQWQTLGLICVGFWGLSRSIPDVVYWVTFLNMLPASEGSYSLLSAEQNAGIISTVVELGIGLWLVFGAKGFAAFLFRVRTAGAPK
jgi:hypothetical protein